MNISTVLLDSQVDNLGDTESLTCRGCIQCGDAEQRDGSCPGRDRAKWREISSCYSELEKFKTYELSISGIIILLIFSDLDSPLVTGMQKTKPQIRRDYSISRFLMIIKIWGYFLLLFYSIGHIY